MCQEYGRACVFEVEGRFEGAGTECAGGRWWWLSLSSLFVLLAVKHASAQGLEIQLAGCAPCVTVAAPKTDSLPAEPWMDAAWVGGRLVNFPDGTWGLKGDAWRRDGSTEALMHTLAS